jgi:hypothetical protein
LKQYLSISNSAAPNSLLSSNSLPGRSRQSTSYILGWCSSQSASPMTTPHVIASSSGNHHPTSATTNGIVGSHFRVGKKIGEGSFGVVFEGMFRLAELPCACYVAMFEMLGNQCCVRWLSCSGSVVRFSRFPTGHHDEFRIQHGPITACLTITYSLRQPPRLRVFSSSWGPDVGTRGTDRHNPHLLVSCYLIRLYHPLMQRGYNG